jgi:subfamily B ATP-binding cassette protein HlyB/CyaB
MHTALTCLELVAKMNRVNVDLRAVIRQYGIPGSDLSEAELIRISKDLGFTVKSKKISLSKLENKYPLPSIFQLKDGTFAAILKIISSEQKVAIYSPVEKKVQELTFEQYDQIASGSVIVLMHKASAEQVKFGFLWFYTEIFRYRRIILEVMLGSFVVQIFGLVTPLFTQVILDKVIVHRTLSTLDVLAIAFLFVSVFEFLLNITRNYIFIHTANKIDAKLGAKLFKHLFALPFAYFESRKVGNIAARVRELDNIREFITNKSVSLLIDLFFSSVFLVMMFLYSSSLTLIVLAFIAVVAIIYATVTPVLRQRLQAKFAMSAESNSYLVESVTGVQTVKSLAIEGSMQRRWEDTLAAYLQASFKLSSLGTFAGNISNTVQRLMTIAILYFGVRLVIENKMTIGQLIAFQMFANQFTNPVLRLVNLWNEFQQTLLAVDRLGDILNHPVESASAKAITLPEVKGAVRFDNVSFQYAPAAPTVLSDFSVSIPAGTSIGIVGRSGSGKSTVAKLVQRLYFPMDGAVYVDGIDVRHMNPWWLRNNIGVVLQENYLFSGTIRDNITLPRPDAPMELIIEAATIAGAHEFITQLPEGYDTLVGERGSALSGGQKQRIAIARAIITNPKILILDEATSALDYESERIIQQNLSKIRAGRTLIIIAHRLSVVANCDNIIVLDKGKIVEEGSPKELVRRGGYFTHLYNQQVGLNAGQIAQT